jgi:hypothetical protein
VVQHHIWTNLYNKLSKACRKFGIYQQLYNALIDKVRVQKQRLRYDIRQTELSRVPIPRPPSSPHIYFILDCADDGRLGAEHV